jgi:hypothetical protein
LRRDFSAPDDHEGMATFSGLQTRWFYLSAAEKVVFEAAGFWKSGSDLTML